MAYSAGNLEIRLLGNGNSAVAEITKTANALNSLSNSLSNTSSQLKSVDKNGEYVTTTLRKIQSTAKSTTAVVNNAGGKSGGGLFGGALGMAKLTTTIYAAMRLGRAVARITKLGSDYVETLNLWQVAMRDNLDMATEFVNKMNKAYSISEKTVMQAQATFKNMIGSLGDLSSETAYQLSEAITQMAIDYSSLYNVSIENAINKFQSALAGQVRPIRSISGYDITEKTIQALYESMGGTKTQRQLSRTEKQLLAIYAVFNQMSASGALGDMSKTLDNFANQSRIMAENWERLGTWIGVSIQQLLQESGIMVKINALLITATELAKAFAFSLGAGQENFIDGIFESAENTNNEVDELQGKLLDFDKFRALSTEEDELSIDQALLNAMSGYSSYLDEANNKAQELAEKWLVEIFGFTKDTNGELVASETTISTIKDTLEKVLIIATLLVAVLTGGWVGAIIWLVGYLYTTNEGFRNLINGLFELLVPIIDVIFELIDALSPVFDFIADLIVYLKPVVDVIVAIIKYIIDAVKALIDLIKLLFSFDLDKARGLVGFTTNVGKWFSDFKLDFFAEGGMPDKGTLFVAGEAGAEMVYSTPSGQSGVANVEQIAQATYNGTTRALNAWWGGMQAKNDIPAFREVSKTGIYEVAKGEMKRRGEW